MNPRITCCRRNLRPRHRRLRNSAQAAASAAVGSWRLLLANATFTERFRISSNPPDRPKASGREARSAYPFQSLGTVFPFRNGEIVPPLHERGEGDRG